MKYIDENKLYGLYDAIRCYMCTNPIRSERGCDGCCDVDGTMYGNVCYVIEEFLTNAKIEAEPIRHGHWVEYERPHYFKCSLCKVTVPYKHGRKPYNGEIRNNRYYNFCPNCGAMMDEVKEQHEV